MLVTDSVLLTQACGVPDFVDVQGVNVIHKILKYAVVSEAAFGHFVDGFVLVPAFGLVQKC